mgnify:CR=1 FL=1
MSQDANDDLSRDEVEIDLGAGLADESQPSDDIEINLDFDDFSEPETSDEDLGIDLSLGDDQDSAEAAEAEAADEDKQHNALVGELHNIVTDVSECVSQKCTDDEGDTAHGRSAAF